MNKLKYVGFFKSLRDEYVLGEGEDGFYFGKFREPNLSELEYFDPAESLAEFERLNEVKVYQKDLVAECKRVLENLEYEVIDDRCIYKWVVESQTGPLEFTFDMTDRVNELKEFINNG